MTSIETENTSNKTVSLSVTFSTSESLFLRTECMKTVVFAAHRREGAVVAPVDLTKLAI